MVKNHSSSRRESSLHASLKKIYAQEGDQVETPLGNYYLDVYNPNLVVEIQTGNFSSLKPKLRDLLNEIPVRIVYPMAQEKYIIRTQVDNNKIISSRKSPRKRTYIDLFDEIVQITGFLLHPNFSLEVLLISMEEIWVNDGKGSWRRKHWSIADRRLRRIIDRKVFASADDYLEIFNVKMETFSVKDISTSMNISKRLASKIAYTMRRIGIFNVISKQGNAFIYRIDESFR